MGFLDEQFGLRAPYMSFCVIVIYIVLKTSSKIERIIGQNGISIIRKIFGVILLAIAVKLFAHNIKELFI